jgi:hypothetical protein
LFWAATVGRSKKPKKFYLQTRIERQTEAGEVLECRLVLDRKRHRNVLEQKHEMRAIEAATWLEARQLV